MGMPGAASADGTAGDGGSPGCSERQAGSGCPPKTRCPRWDRSRGRCLRRPLASSCGTPAVTPERVKRERG